LYTGAKGQIDILLVELRKLRTQNPEFRIIIDLLERFLIDFDKLAGVQRIIAVPTEKIVEKEVDRAVLVPTKDSEIIRNELAMSVLIEKLITEIKKIKKSNPSLQLSLDDDVLLIFFTELYDKQNLKNAGDFTKSLKEYTQSAVAKFTQMGGNWTYDHELMLNTILEERFAMANLVKQANLEIEKVRSISDKRAAALREKETQFLQISKQLSEFYNVVNTLNQSSEGSKLFSGSSNFSKLFGELGQWIKSDFVVRLEEPYKIIGDFVGSGNEWNRVQSLLREREREIELLKTRIFDIEKNSKRTSVSGGNDSALYQLRSENERLTRELTTLRSSSTSSKGDANTIAFLTQENQRLNQQIQSLQSSASSSSSNTRNFEVTITQLREEHERLIQQVNTFKSSSSSGSGSSSGQEHTIAFLKQENERLNSEISRLRQELSSAPSSSQLKELEIKLKTAQSRIEELESQVRNYELQLRSFKDSKSSAASSVADGNSSRIQMSESQYSSSSTSSNNYVSGGSGSTYQTPSYGQSGYNYGTTALSGSSIKEGTTYGTTGVTGTSSYGTSGTTYGTSGLTGASSVTSSAYGTSGLTGTTGTTGTTYGTTGTTYGATGITGTTSGSRVTGQTTTSTYERKSNLGGSGVSGSGYNYQTKKY
jgi:DNA repair exonuclease SbcCD ATPase subunit